MQRITGKMTINWCRQKCLSAMSPMISFSTKTKSHTGDRSVVDSFVKETKEDHDHFMNSYNMVKPVIMNYVKQFDTKCGFAAKATSELFDYNKKLGQLGYKIAVNAVQHLKEDLTEEEIRLANVIGIVTDIVSLKIDTFLSIYLFSISS